MSKYEAIELEISEADQYAIIHLNRPDQLNAINTQLNYDFCSALEEVSVNNKIRCLMITGKGRAFCGGGDLVEFNNAEDPESHLYTLAKKLHEGIKTLKGLDIPSIAAVNGACYGVGLSLACACDLRICSENAKFAVAFTRVGVSPDSSLTFHLPKIVGLSLANEMALLNRVLDANEAKQYNLVSDVISSEEDFLEEARNVARKISQGPTRAYGSTKKLFIQSYHNDLETQLEEEAENLRKNAATEDFKEATSSFVAKKKPIFKGK
jgi:2-(1,2-epoxy-1,2-dihydrophenyl)acetyl-CoA isomerase